MGKYTDHLDLRHYVGKDKTLWTVLSPITYVSNDGEIYSVPEGFITDLASIPRPFWSLLPPHWRYAKASVVHDYMLSVLKIDYRRCNFIFREGMVSLGVNRQQVFIIYVSVSLYWWFKTKVLRKKL